jgi:aminodeoxyfutalosine deaminase
VLSGRQLCTHLAETREELQFLRDGSGSFRELLEEWGLWDGTFQPPGCSPVDYMARLNVLEAKPAPLLVHVNYVSDADLDLLANTSCSVAWCPRTHRFFHHEPHRFRDMLARGINVCIGTDSLASNDTLSILDELRFAWRRSSGSAGAQGRQPVSQQCLLAMGTIAGARALGLEDQVGSLEPGKRADLAAVPLEQPRAADPLEDLLGGNTCSTTIYSSAAGHLAG